ncbi:MAG TPA: autotransporter outer membrane beta-barrel domain-containing protein, partial [Sphingomonadales bacterium]
LDLYRDGGAAAGFYAGAGEISAQVDAVHGGRSGKAELAGYSLGGYWVQTASNGAWFNLVLQGTRYEGDLDFAAGDSFDPSGWAVAGSVEGGHPFALGAFVFEPQAQFVVQHLDLKGGRDRVASIRYENGEAYYGRLGARLARTWLASDDRPVTVSGRFNLWHDFDRDAKTRIATPGGLNPADFRASLGGTWGQGQLMVSGLLTPAVTAYVSGDYSFSLDGTDAEGFGGRVGLRVSF